MNAQPALTRPGLDLGRPSLAAGLRNRAVRIGRAGALLVTLRVESERVVHGQAADGQAAYDSAAEDQHDRHLSAVGTRL